MNKYHSTAFLVFSMLFLLNCSPQSEKSTALKELISAERAFAQLSAGTGMGTAFLTYLADDAIVFNPRPVKGKSRYLSVQDLPRRLIWEPYWADVSISGELGFTSGPWEFRQQRPGDSADTYGHYVSVWKKADDNWRVILDIGISHDFPGFLLEDSVSEVKKPDYLTVYHIGEAKNIAVTRFMLLEQVFSLTAQDSGINAAYRKYSAPEIMIYREGMFPRFSLKSGLDLIKNRENGNWTWRPSGGGISNSGDFGYTYGISEESSGPAASGNIDISSYLHIWRNFSEEGWQLVLDITNPVPDLPE